VNHYGNEGAIALAKAFHVNRAVKYAHLDSMTDVLILGSVIENDGANALGKALEVNPILNVLNLYCMMTFFLFQR
jgi:hypothetical protein